MLAEGLRTDDGRPRFSIRASAPIDLPPASLPTDPLVFGTQLANVVQPLDAIPEEYLRASWHQRLLVLRGLMDIRGTVDDRGEFGVFVRGNLAYDVLSLVRSLGIVASLHNTGTSGNVIRFTTDLPVLSALSDGPQADRGKVVDRLYVQDMVAIPSEPGRCLQVDSPDSSYLCADFVPTHNTFFMQWMALQSAWLGRTVFYINPKPQDDLAPLVRLAGQKCRAELINLGDAVNDPGAFDPFRFAPKGYIHEIAAQFIIDVLGKDWDDRTQTRLMSALQRAVLSGQVHCLWDAIQYIDDDSTKETIMELVESNSMFALAFAKEPKPRMDASHGLTLIQFDQVLPDTDDERTLSIPDRVLLAVMRLIPRVSLEVLLRADGGDLYIDEAHRLLGSRAGRSFIERQGREGRSQGIMSVLGTHKPTEIVNAGVSEFMGRIFALKLQKGEEAAAALDLIGFDPTDETRIKLMRTELGPMAPNHAAHQPAKPASAFHRDINRRKGLITIYPIPEWVRVALSTSTEDRLLRRRTAEAGPAKMDSNIINV